jgi:hypothetical protein
MYLNDIDLNIYKALLFSKYSYIYFTLSYIELTLIILLNGLWIDDNLSKTREWL